MSFVHSDSGNDVGVSTATAPPDAKARLYQTIASVLGVEPETLVEDSSPDTVEAWDSLNHLNIAMALESEFGVAFEAEDIMTMRDVKAIGAALRRQGADL
jgi:acyl carrier protein